MGWCRALGDGQIGEGRVPLFMQSNGGLIDGRLFEGKDAILSGPAGGIVGMARTAEEAGFDAVIGFDMGGTSTDVSLYAGRFERDNETIVAGARIRRADDANPHRRRRRRIDLPVRGWPLHRRAGVGGGGAGACLLPARRPADGHRLQCHARQGPAGHFPHLFGPDGAQPLDVAAVDGALRRTGRGGPAHNRPPRGWSRIAVANMANAIKAISVARGHDVARFTLACFGGAGGQHACLVADELGMDRVMIHPLAGVLSAFGMGLADRRVLREQTFGLSLIDAEMPVLGEAIAALSEQAEGAPRSQHIGDAPVRIEVQVHLRYAGTDSR
jgi:5-oxoprolinase (ATP-hydrolysing)